MFKLCCVTHRGLCAGDLPQRVGELCRDGIDRVILREKDLTEEEYEVLARQVVEAGGEAVVLHHFPGVCTRLGVPRLHLSLGELEACPQLRDQVELLGVSVHAPAEAVRAQALGADYATAGHVFDTDCKKACPAGGWPFWRRSVPLLPFQYTPPEASGRTTWRRWPKPGRRGPVL